jgi:hypothetical protein
MKGDYFRYKAEIAVDKEKEVYSEKALKEYQQAYDFSK